MEPEAGVRWTGVVVCSWWGFHGNSTVVAYLRRLVRVVLAI